MSGRLLRADEVVRRCDPADLGFRTTAELPDGAEGHGQQRATTAIELALDVPHGGYNLFVMGPTGSGRRALVRRAIAAQLSRATNPRPDWVYVNNFALPHRPLALELPAGRGALLRDRMRRLVDELRTTVPAVFESEEYATQAERIDSELSQRANKAVAEVAAAASSQGIAMIRTPSGFTFAPQRKDEVMSPQEFDQLPADEQQRIHAAIEQAQEQLVRVLRNSLRLRKEHTERIRALNRATALLAVEHAIDDLKTEFAGLPRVLQYLDAVRSDVIDNVDDFRRAEPGPREAIAGEPAQDLRRYQVNLLLDAAGDDGSALVEADFPSVQNLVGRIDHIARFGTLLTDFGLIKAGQLHRANGGYLLVDALQLLSQPFAWQTLKRALQRREIRIESMAEMVSLVSTTQLDPEPIPLQIKIVMFGDRELHAMLQRFDPEFESLFRIDADLSDDIARDPAAERWLAAALATRARARGLLPLDAAAVARIVEHAARLAGDATRLSARMQRLVDVAEEANRAARAAGSALIDAGAVDAARAARRDRAARAPDLLRQAMMRDEVLIDTAGARVGQINGLAVFESGGELFGAPSRITATTRCGEGQVVDIQRETRLGGPIHSKGVLILGAFLAARYARFQSYALAASLVFEQSYGPVEGDSASLAELVALLSSLAGVALRQSLAMTGSVNQLGQVQAIGGVNEKIEGFFDLCAARGLDGAQGVVIPQANVAQLMLRDDVVAAIAAGRFAVHAVASVDDAIELLAGVPAGAPEPPFASGSINGRIAARLREFAAVRRGEPRFGRATPRAPRRPPSGPRK